MQKILQSCLFKKFNLSAGMTSIFQLTERITKLEVYTPYWNKLVTVIGRFTNCLDNQAISFVSFNFWLSI